MEHRAEDRRQRTLEWACLRLQQGPQLQHLGSQGRRARYSEQRQREALLGLHSSADLTQQPGAVVPRLRMVGPYLGGLAIALFGIDQAAHVL